MSFNAVTCQNYFFRSPLVLFSAAENQADYSFLCDYFYCGFREKPLTFCRQYFIMYLWDRFCDFPQRKNGMDSSYPWISDFNPQTFPQVLTVIYKSTAEILNIFLRCGPSAVLFLLERQHFTAGRHLMSCSMDWHSKQSSAHMGQGLNSLGVSAAGLGWWCSSLTVGSVCKPCAKLSSNATALPASLRDLSALVSSPSRPCVIKRVKLVKLYSETV